MQINDLFQDLLKQANTLNDHKNGQENIVQAQLEKSAEEQYHQRYKKTKNTEHTDYGREIAHARKDLYGKGNLHYSQFNELSEDDKINKVNKKAIWQTPNPIEFQERGYSPLGFHFVKAVMAKFPNEPKHSKYIYFTSDPFIDYQIQNFLYLVAGNELKESLLANPITATTINNEESYAQLKHFHKLMQHMHFHDQANVLGIAISMDLSKNKDYYKNLVIEHFPEHEERLKRVDSNMFEIAIKESFGNFYSEYCLRNFSSMINSAFKAYAKKQTWDSIINVKTEIENSKINKLKSTDELVDNIDNMSEMVTLFNSTRIKLSHNNMSAVKIDSMLKQDYLSNVTRNGYDFIGAEDKKIDAELMNKVFGVDAIQWGNWVTGENERQNLLNLTFDSFSDLAEKFNIDRKAIGLTDDGTGKGLALGYGSQGKAGARAHYDSAQKFLHMNRMNSAGSLAHEWFHALDNYLFKKAIEDNVISKELQLELGNNRYLSEAVAFLATNVYDNQYSHYKDEFEVLKQYNPEFVQLIIDMNGSFEGKTRKTVTLANISAMDLEYLSSRGEDGEAENAIRGSLFQINKDGIGRIKTIINNIGSLYKAIDLLKPEEMDLNHPAFQELSRFVYMNQQLLNSNINTILSSSNDSQTFEDIFRTKTLKRDFDEYFLNDFIKGGIKEELDKALLKECKKIYKDIYTQENVLKISETFNDHFFKFVEDTSNKFMPNLMQKNELFKGESIFDKAISKHTDIINSGIKYEFYKTAKQMFSQPIIREQYHAYIKNEFKNNFGKQIAKICEENDFPEIYKTIMHSQLLRHTHEFSEMIANYGLKKFNQSVAMELLNNNLPLTIDIGSRFKAHALILDNYTAKKYYSSPCEMFARMGETVIASKTLNTYLTKEKNSNAIMGSLGISPYPEGKELERFDELLSKSIKNVFKADFELDLTQLNKIDNQYSKDERLSESKSTKMKMKMGSS